MVLFTVCRSVVRGEDGAQACSWQEAKDPPDHALSGSSCRVCLIPQFDAPPSGLVGAYGDPEQDQAHSSADHQEGTDQAIHHGVQLSWVLLRSTILLPL